MGILDLSRSARVFGAFALAGSARSAAGAVFGLFGLLGWGGASSAVAATPAGTIIQGQAFVDYYAAGVAEPYRSLSNIASVRVKGVLSGALEPDNIREARPGEVVTLVHVLRNTGNVDGAFSLSLAHEAGLALIAPRMFIDANRNGIYDTGDQLISTPILLPHQGETSAQILILGQTPATAISGSTIDLRISAQIAPLSDEQIETRPVAPARDLLTIQRPDEARLSKSVGLSCEGRVALGDEIPVTIGVHQANRLAAYVRTLRVDGASTRGVLIEEAVMTAASPTTAQPEISLTGAYPLVGFGEGASTVWRSWSAWSGAEKPSRVALMLPERLLSGANLEVRMSYRLRALGAGAVAAFTSNPVTFDAEGDANLTGAADLSAASPCPPVTVAACFAGAASAFATPDFTNATVGAALDAARSTLVYFNAAATDSATPHDAVASLILRAPGAAAVAGELTVRVTDDATGDHVSGRMVQIPGQPEYYQLETSLRLQLAAAAGRGEICGAGEYCPLQSHLRSRLRAEVSAATCLDSIETEAMVGGWGVAFAASLPDTPVVPGATVTFSAAQSTAGAFSAGSGSVLGATSFSASSFQEIARATADDQGRFALPQSLPTGEYCVTASKTGYSFPSSQRDRTTRYLVEPVIASGCAENGLFTVEPVGLRVAGVLAVGLDLPLDVASIPIDDQGLWVEKSVSTSTVQTGDFLRYEISVENRTGRALSDAMVRDEAARGLAYAQGSLRVDGLAPASDAWSFEAPGANLFRIGAMAAGETRKLSYVMRVGAGASGELVNSAYATGLRPNSQRVDSPSSQARVRVRNEGVLSDRNYLIGRVAVASVCEKLPAEIDALGIDDAGVGTLRLPRADGTSARPRVWPLAGARVWLETGVYAVTDERGYYSLYGLPGGPHVARLDGETTPRGLAPAATRTARSAGGWSQFVNLRFGDLARADFYLPADCAQMEELWPVISTNPAEPRIERELDEAVRFETRIRDVEADLRARARGDGDLGRGLTGDLRADTPLSERSEAQTADNAAPQKRDRPSMPKSEEAVKSVTAEMAREGRWLWPRDGISRDGRFMAVIRAGADPVLHVNGAAIPQTQLGERLHSPSARAELVAWYGVNLKPGENLVEIRGQDQFGNQRTLATSTVRRPGAAARLTLESDRLSLPADGGRSMANLTLKLTDSAGIPVEGVTFATLHAEDGLWMVEDLDGKARGLQVRLEDGVARVALASSVRAGPVLVTAEGDDNRLAELRLRFSADERPLMAVGLLAFEANFAGRGWRLPESLRAIDEFDDFSGESYEIGGRGAVFLKGKIRGDALLTLLYDSSRRDENDLFRDLDPNAYYPVYGDGSITGYEAQARSPLYVRLEKGGFVGMWGDFATDAENDLKLGGLRRNLTGVNASYENEDWRVQGFAARPNSSSRNFETQGLGLAMGYRLPGAPIASGTDRLEIIARDRLNPGIVLSRREMRRGSDYALDYDSGRLDFFSPIPSFDDDRNPVYISASYETQTTGEAYTVAGVRVERRFGEDFRVGGAYSHVDDPAERNRLAAVYGEYKPSDDLRLRAEGAWSRNPDTGATGTAMLVEGEAKLPGDWRVDGGFGRADADFQSDSAAVSSGRMEARAGVQGPLGGFADLRAQGTYSADLETDQWRASAEAELRKPIGPVEARLGLRHEQSETSSERIEQSFVTGGLRASTEIFGAPVSGELEVAKAVDTPAFRANARIDVDVAPGTAVYLKHEFANDDATLTGPEGDGYLSAADAFSQGRTAFGVEHDWRSDTRVYTETRLTGYSGDRGTENVIGLRGDYVIKEGVTLQAQAENVRAFSGDASDSTAVSLGLRDERRKDMSRAFRLESRVQEDDWTFGATAAIEGRATEELTLFAAARYEGRLPETGFDSHSGNVKLGAAFRPTNNRTHVLALYEGKYEREAVASGDETFTHILSAHLNAQLTDRLQFSGRIGARFSDFRFDGRRYRGDAELIDARVIYAVNDRLSFEGRGGALTTGRGDSLSWSGGLGINYAATENVEFGVGYNFSGFRDEDLDPQGFNREGVYMRINLKFDEGLFNWLAAP